VALGQGFDGDRHGQHVTIKIDSSQSAAGAGNKVRFEAGLTSPTYRLVSGSAPGIFESLNETYGNQTNWLIAAGAYIVVVSSLDATEIEFHGIKTEIR
jgi:hypothetical protein